MKEVYIVSVARTPIGSFNGSLAAKKATELGSLVIRKAMEKIKLDPTSVDEVFMGNVISANVGQAPATQASIGAGISNDTPTTTVNKVCASGMKAIMLGAQSIQLGQNEIVVAGGMESMSNVPYYLPNNRSGAKLGHGQVIDGIIRDGLWDVYKDYHMGNAAELCATDMNISREDQDEYAITSYKRAAAAWSAGKFDAEIVEVEIPVRGKDPLIVRQDEDYTKVNFEKMAALKPVFVKDGTVTAANASNLNDGASAVILMSKEKADALGIKPIARILGYADAQQAPEWFTTAPAKAIPLALKRAGVTPEQVDFYEINEAFAVVCVANNNLLKLNPEKVNVYGGGVSIGHPIGSSGARIVATLTSVLHQESGKIGVAGICNGGGGASAIVIEKM
jgi:acetyl-CoA C-acetyltransferase